MTLPKTAKKIFEDHINTINAECCENDYPQKEEIYSIKNILEDCLNSKCQNKLIPIYDPKKPPLKILAFKESQKLDNLILDHEKFKYNKLSKKTNDMVKRQYVELETYRCKKSKKFFKKN